MIVVTPRYYSRRKWNARRQLPWHRRNELDNYGYLTVVNYGYRRRFSIADWLGWNCETRRIMEADWPMRFSELDEGICWSHVRHPWEVDDDGQEWLTPQFSSIEEKMKYIDKIFDDLKCDRCGVLYPPFDGLPILWASKNGKVTLY